MQASKLWAEFVHLPSDMLLFMAEYGGPCGRREPCNHVILCCIVARIVLRSVIAGALVAAASIAN